MIKPRVVSKVSFCLLLGLLGFLGNWFRLELFFNVDYLIGSLFVMLAILMMGGVCGVITGFIAATCTYFLWHHPWAIVIMTGEALFVAWAYTRRKGNIVIYDAIYWLIIGMPLIYLFYHQIMAIPLQSTLLIMFKQSVNGILNSLMALTLYIVIKQWAVPQEERVPYSQLIFATIATLVLIPAMLLLIIGMRIYLAEEKEALTAKLAYTAEEAQSYLAGWIKERHLTVQTMSALVGDPNTSKPADMQHLVETLKAASPAFSKMGIMNENGRTVAYAPPEIDGKSTLGVDFSDRPYIRILKKEKRPLIPDVIMGKQGTPTPAALLLSPIVVGGKYRGYAVGVIDIKEFLPVFASMQKRSNSNVTLVDGSWQVIASSIPDLGLMSPFARPYNRNRSIPVNEAFRWLPEPEPGTSIMKRWEDSLLVKAVPLSPDYGWKVIVEEPFLPIVQNISQFSIYGLGLLGLLTFLTVAILQVFSQGIVSTVVRLQNITKLLPQRLTSAAAIAWPDSRIMELQGLCSNFQNMTVSLQEREEALKESQRQAAFLADLVESSSQPFAIRGLDGGLGFFNAAYHDMLGYTREELEALHFVPRFTPPEWCDKEDTYLQEILRTGQPRRYEKQYLRKDGSRMPAELFVHLRRAEPGQPVFYGFITDITERKRAEEELRRAHDELEQRVQERTAQLRRQAEEIQDLYDNAPCGYHSLDREGVFVRMNNTELEWLGYTREEVIGRMKFSNILTAEGSRKFQDLFPDFKKRGRVEGLEYELIRNDGTLFPVVLNATAIRDDAGNFLMSRGTLFDISERKEVEAALKESEERLRYLSFRLLTSKEDLQKEVAWELHEDLAQSLMVLKMALRQVLPEDSAGAKAESQVVLNQVSELIQKVRSISYSLRPPSLGLGLTKALQSLLQETLGDQDMELSLNLCDLDGLFPDEDQIGIYRVFQEALANIFSHAQASHVAVTAEEQEDMMCFQIIDNGRGFDLMKVQGRAAADKRLGLTTIAERVRLLGGDLKISSAKGQGTTVGFCIPISRA